MNQLNYYVDLSISQAKIDFFWRLPALLWFQEV